MRKAEKGFTIIEVLIFLAISGTMFLVAFLGMRGQQDSVGFRQSLNSIELKIREIFNNVDNGYFGNTGQYTCSTNASNEPSLTPAVGGGGNSGACVFIGKTIDFNVNSSQMSIATLIGSRLATNLTYGTTLIEASQLAETYAINNGVIWKSSRLYKSDGSSSSTTGLRVSVQRDRNAEDNVQADLRAQRKYKVDASEVWSPVNDDNTPMFCFELDSNRKGSIKITQKDIVVDYNGEGCPNNE
jgi:hypothetical protein